jgi:hypothetical protein
LRTKASDCPTDPCAQGKDRNCREADLQARLKIEAEQMLDELRNVAVFNLADVLVI